MSSSAAGFWSYVHDDDDAENGRISRLARLIKAQFDLLTGADLELFIDHDLRWGDEWKRRIDEAIAGTTFFIPILTPRYFASDECRREFVRFTSTALRSGLSELILPVHYVDVPELSEEDPADEAIQRIKGIHWIDWRQRRLFDEGSAEVRGGLDEMARRLAEIAQSVSRVPDNVAAKALPAAAHSEGTSEEADDAPGVIELMADAEGAWPRLNEALTGITTQIEAAGHIVHEWSPKLERATNKGAGPALLVFGEIAKGLDAPATRIETLGKQYASELTRIDPAVLVMLRSVEMGESSQAEAQELLDSIHSLNAAADEALVELRSLVQTLDQVGALSRDLRRPLRKMREGVKNVLDGQAVLQEWDRRVSEIESASPPDQTQP
jgi:hypothetical protein